MSRKRSYCVTSCFKTNAHTTEGRGSEEGRYGSDAMFTP